MMATDSLFLNLKVLASVRQHERLRTRSGELLDVSPRGPLEGIRRYLSGETRSHNLSQAHAVLHQAFTYLAMARERDPRPSTFIERLCRELRAAREGCVALLATYENDTISRARLQCMIESIDTHLRGGDEILVITTNQQPGSTAT